MTEVEASKLLTVLISAFPDGLRFLDEDQQTNTRKLYREFLRDLPYDAGNAGIARLIATSRRWPSIADLRGVISLYMHGRPMVALEAWGEIRKLGNWQRPERWQEIDGVVRACLESLGWITKTTVWSGTQGAVCWRVSRGDSDNEAADRARWCELYEQLSGRHATELAVGELAPPIPARRIAAPAPQMLGDIVAGLLPKETK